MNSIFSPGSHCWLDGTTQVVVLKAVTRSHSTYNVEIPGKAVVTVAQDRLSLITDSNPKPDAHSD